MYNVVNTLVSSFLIGSSSFLQVTRTAINFKSLMSFKFGQIQLWTAELAALDHVTKSFTYMYLRTIQNIYIFFFSLTSLSRLFHSYRDEPIGGAKREYPGKTT